MRRRLFFIVCLLTFLGAAALSLPRAAKAQGDQQIYADALAANWQNWSWCAVDFNSKDYVHAGASSVKVSFTGGWQGFYLHCDPQSTTNYNKLTFWINGGTSSGRNLSIAGLVNGAAQNSVGLNQFIVGGGVAANTWRQVTVPLATIGLNAVAMSGFWIADNSGSAQAPFYVDDATLVSANAAPVPQVLAIDFKAGTHPISPFIYGMAFANGSALPDLNTPLNRWGGNATSMHNWLLNASNYGSDWYFESIGDADPTPSASADIFVQGTLNVGAQPMITIPTIGWVAKLGTNRAKTGSFSQSKYGAQKAAEGDLGNGILANGQFVTNDPNDANIPADSTYQQNWARHFVGKMGTAAKGGLTYYILDNEPGLWHQTHRDVHPIGATMDEMKSKIIDYAGKIKAVDAGAQIVGPEEWGWTNYFYSGYDAQYAAAHNWSSFPDRAAHNNMDMMPWLLDQLHQYDTANKTKSLDVFSLHYYPQGGEFGNDTSAAMQQRRNRSTRSLWDPNYVDETWINAAVQMIPRMKSWVNTYYPGLKTAITEYNFGAEGHINGATTLADVLGIFGREGLDMATYWTTPAPGTPAYNAVKMYRNVDGSDQTFGDVSVSDMAPDPDNLSSFASVRSSDGAQTVMVINKNLTSALPVTVNAANCNAVSAAQAWQLTSANAITRLPDVTLQTANAVTTLQITLPPQSITLFVIPAAPKTPAVTTISGLFNTGVDSYNNPVADSGSDSHYTLVSASGSSGSIAPFITQQHFPIQSGLWLLDTNISKWISPVADEASYIDKPGDYTYQTSFTITGDSTLVSITGKVVGDDQIKAIILNGKTIISAPFGGLNYWSNFTLSSGFVSGVNTLQFVVTNMGTVLNPSGFRCEMTGKVQASGNGTGSGAGSVSGLFSTGLDANKNTLADASGDPHYSLVSTPGGGSGTPVVTQQTFPIYPGFWLADTDASKWISPHTDELANLEAPGDYTYQTTFTVTGDPNSASIQGRFAIDSVLKAVILNGKTVLSGPVGNINYWSDLALTSGFVSGTNTLQFVITRIGTVPNPSGFRFEVITGQ